MRPAAQLSLSFCQPDIAFIELREPDGHTEGAPDAIPEQLARLLGELAANGKLIGLIIALPARHHRCTAETYAHPFASLVDDSPEEIAERARAARSILAKLSECPFVTAAAVDGSCWGWAAELACWCDIRVAAEGPETRIGFPDVQWGLIPAWGGTVRVPRLVGLGNAIRMIAEGESVDARGASEIGLVDAVCPRGRLVDTVVKAVRSTHEAGDYLKLRRQRQQPLAVDQDAAACDRHGDGNSIDLRTAETPCASSVACELLFDSAACTSVDAGELESNAIGQLVGSPVHRGLLYAGALVERNQRVDGSVTQDKPLQIDSVGVIGAGIMGAGIAAANLAVRIPVVMTDASPTALRHGVQAVLEHDRVERESHAAASPSVLLTGSENEGDVAACDLVIETVVENMGVKRRIYDRLEPLLAPHTILTSNTSTLPITELAERLSRPDRFCGLHFLNPVRQRRLVEVIRGPASSEATIASVVAYVKRLGKMPIVVGDGPGFLINRLLCAYLNEAQELLCQGVPMAEIDRAAEAFGMRLGPIGVYDLIGIDTAFYAGRSMWDAFPDRIGLLPLIPAMVKRNRLGRKTGLGFHRYDTPEGPPIPDPEIEVLIERYVRRKLDVDQDTITRRLFLAMFLEATRVLESGIVRDPRDVDTGIVFGLGFPRFRGGIMFWADSLGAARILEMLRPLEELGPRFQATRWLIDKARSRRKFCESQADGV
jgi:3-hydroxyacyl-CoA dehydrogenase/enoyl-CoA hydratase/3-hydroxybutyryl-CoA epimerase/3-hydroxyacyl-CoA dehydrogenase/enoyl-CoA hydratase/3-hydroxybutyryl-CoA epimerase/enoyl-CoA isomerase